MGDYLVVNRPRKDDRALAFSDDLRELAQQHRLVVTELNPQTWIAVCGSHPPKVLAVGGWQLVGDVFDRRSPSLPRTGVDDPLAYERKMVARFWGRYAGVRFGSDDQMSALLRDPSGAMECITWRQEGLTFAASFLPEWLIRRLSPPWRIDTARLAQALRDPVAATGPLMIAGPVALEPGTIQRLPADGPAVAIWTPVEIARRSLNGCPSLEEASALLRAAIDESVGGFARLPGAIAAEVSGGLDSSILASSLVHQARDKVGLWVNAVGSTPEADERRYVEALAETLDISPLCVPHATNRLTEDGLGQLSQGVRPGLNALDQAHDLDWADRFQALGVTTVMTGKGGDSILLQRLTPDVFIDLSREKGWRALYSSDARELAAVNEVSVWALLQRARRHARDGHRWPVRDDPLFGASEAEPTLHPWLEDCDGFGPAKTLQIAGVADGVSRHGPSLLTQAVDVVHPLCSQPVIEACLALPISLLTTGGRDRGLARLAFCDRLPEMIVSRRSKGDMTRIYGRMVLDNLEVLRPWLMDGRLAALGLIDRAEADRQLSRESLIWRGKYSTVMVAAAFESWVRTWENRLAWIT